MRRWRLAPLGYRGPCSWWRRRIATISTRGSGQSLARINRQLGHVARRLKPRGPWYDARISVHSGKTGVTPGLSSCSKAIRI